MVDSIGLVAEYTDNSTRFFQCARCGAEVLICRSCDHGQIYCAGGCSEEARRSSVKQAGRRYQSSRQGRFAHAERSRRYRERKKVTHQGSIVTAVDDLLT
ncbi:TPA: hypothetical protein ACIE75_005504, partial [Klebsiella pneumoniae]